MSEGIDVTKLGIIRAIVVNEKDPKVLCRIQIRIPSIHGVVGSSNYRPDIELPWAYPSLPANMKQVPRKGQFVWILFENNDIQMPIYMGVVLGKGSATSDVPLLIGSKGSVLVVPKSSYEAPAANNNAGTIFESTLGFTFTYDDGVNPDGSDGRMNIHKDNTDFVLGKDLTDITVGEAKVHITPDVLESSVGEAKSVITKDSVQISVGSTLMKVTANGSESSMGGAIVKTDSSGVTMSMGGSSMSITSSGITLSIGGTSITLSSDSLTLVSPVINENP